MALEKVFLIWKSHDECAYTALDLSAVGMKSLFIYASECAKLTFRRADYSGGKGLLEIDYV